MLSERLTLNWAGANVSKAIQTRRTISWIGPRQNLATHLDFSSRVRVTETELGDGNVSSLHPALDEHLLLMQPDTSDQLERSLCGITRDAHLSLDRSGQTPLRDTEEDSRLLLVAFSSSTRSGRGDDEVEQRFEVRVQHALGDVVGVLESLGGGGEGEERGQLDHAGEDPIVVDGVLELLGAGGDLLLLGDGEEGVTRGALEENVGERAGHCGGDVGGESLIVTGAAGTAVRGIDADDERRFGGM